MVTDLERLPVGHSAVVVGFEGGWGLSRKVDAMGLRPGKRVHKLGSQLLRGPVIVLVDGRQVAMGRGIARRIHVRPLARGG
jgi:ferrous iron transport protein A